MIMAKIKEKFITININIVTRLYFQRKKIN